VARLERGGALAPALVGLFTPGNPRNPHASQACT
jgi:hypothetical protein